MVKLSQWLKAKGIKRYVFAQRIGVSPSQVTSYCMGKSFPHPETIRRITAETQGEITADDLVRDLRTEPLTT